MDSGRSTPRSLDSGESNPAKERAHMRIVAARVEAAVAQVQAQEQRLPQLQSARQSPDLQRPGGRPETISRGKNNGSGRLSTDEIDEQFARYLGPAEPGFVPEDKHGPPTAASREPRQKGQNTIVEEDRKESYACKILRQKANRDALTAAAEEKMAQDAEAGKQKTATDEAEPPSAERRACDGAYKDLPRVKAKLEVLKGMLG